MSLVDFIANVVGEAPLRVEESLGGGYVRLRVAEAERRQAKHDIRWVEDIVVEILRNARDAGAKNIWLATSRMGDLRSITCIDDGSGIPEGMRERVFEARVTSKLDTMTMDRWGVHGRGMALYSIRENADEARVIASAPGGGTSIGIAVDCTKLAERADQSTWPTVGTDEGGGLVAKRGPRNIARIVVEFALDARGRGTVVYLGSPAEVLATLAAVGDSTADSRFPADAPWLLPSCSTDPRALKEAGERIGLAVSERTAYRILAGDIEPLASVYDTVAPHDGHRTQVDLLRDRRGLKISQDDLADFSNELEGAFSILAQRYYLELVGTPRIRVSRDSVTVTFNVAKED